MISVQSAMLVALGFLAASLLGLLVASAFWGRAVRLTTARIRQSMPVSEPEIKADRDRLRAEYAIKVHKLEMEVEQAKVARVRHIIDLNRRDASIAKLESSVTELRADLEENQNARRVLEQTVADRLPRVEARLAEAKRVLFNRDREIAELATAARRSKQALEEASLNNAQKNAQIERLTTITTRGGRDRSASGDASDGEVGLRAEVETLRGKASEQALLIDRLQRRLGHGHALAGPAKAVGGALADGTTDRVRKEIAEAETAIDQVRSGSAEADAAKAGYEREVRALTAKTEDQAGEIARLKAALAAFEQEAKSAGLKDSKIALKARLGSAQAQADQQASTIAKLRAELAATHERLAKQAAHFMGEMRRIGGGAGQVRRPLLGEERRSLVERVAHVRASSTVARALPQPVLPEPPQSEPAPAGNSQNGNGNGNGSETTAPDPARPEGLEAGTEGSAAPEMPQPGGIPEKRPRTRLLDRITGATKG